MKSPGVFRRYSFLGELFIMIPTYIRTSRLKLADGMMCVTGIKELPDVLWNRTHIANRWYWSLPSHCVTKTNCWSLGGEAMTLFAAAAESQTPA